MYPIVPCQVPEELQQFAIILVGLKASSPLERHCSIDNGFCCINSQRSLYARTHALLAAHEKGSGLWSLAISQEAELTNRLTVMPSLKVMGEQNTVQPWHISATQAPQSQRRERGQIQQCYWRTGTRAYMIIAKAQSCILQIYQGKTNHSIQQMNSIGPISVALE